MVQAPSKTLTLAEFLQLPETKPASEYIDGQIIQKPMPQGKQSVIQGELLPAINGVVKPKRIARTFPELPCTFRSRSTVLILQFFFGTEFLAMRMGRLPTHFLLHQIGQLKSCLLIKAKQSNEEYSALSAAWNRSGLVNRSR